MHASIFPLAMAANETPVELRSDNRSGEIFPETMTRPLSAQDHLECLVMERILGGQTIDVNEYYIRFAQPFLGRPDRKHSSEQI